MENPLPQSIKGVTERLEHVINQEIGESTVMPVSKTPRAEDIDRKLIGLEELQRKERKEKTREVLIKKIKSKSPNNILAVLGKP
jgi:hypothetical protein